MSTSNGYVKYNITVNENSVDIANNKSNVTVSVRFFRTNSGYETYGSGTIWCKINGTQYSNSITSSQKITNSGIVLFSYTLDIYHNSDGSKSLETSSWINITSVLTSSEQYYYQNLTTIPRSSGVSGGSGNIEGTSTISINRASSNFTHILYYSFGSISWSYIASNVGTSYVWTLPSTIYAQIPNSNSGSGTIHCETYTNNGNTYIGNSSCSFTATVTNSYPTFSSSNISYQDTNSSVTAITGNNQWIVRNQSNLKVTFTSATAKNSASMSNYQITFNGSTQTKTSAATIDYGVVNSGNSLSFSIKAIDSRGNYTSVSKTITIYDWLLPSAIITLYRQNNYENTTYIKSNVSISSVNSKNSIVEIRCLRKKTGDSSWTYFTMSNNTQYSRDCDNKYSWDFRFEIKDKFGTTIYNLVLAKGTPIMYFDTQKISVGINRFPENTNSLEVGDIYSNGKKLTFDTIYPIGAIYLSVVNTNPSNYFGGTWVLWGSGRVPICVNTSDSDFNTVEKTGGVKTHRHNFRIGMHWWYGAAAGEGSNNGTGAYRYSADNYDGWARSLDSISTTINTGYTTSANTNNPAGKYSIGDTDVGSGVQPYITCYMWKRTA
ncbi:MAG: hypothetical protein RsTaC01_0924 [Candidatus Paraimprobicoccus trichonymphae]|uniref:Uncharacterized protein n=1 Tax=Candidatus Paraimprobicoccus trichonymphae TaxID=3033793 RepID=A0AA48HX16_9FIRM|nr:MAG: hypothetical protein RsTaC01_0924 [Candidatus Paraimprobicoccus trichonymphae]